MAIDQVILSTTTAGEGFLRTQIRPLKAVTPVRIRSGLPEFVHRSARVFRNPVESRQRSSAGNLLAERAVRGWRDPVDSGPGSSAHIAAAAEEREGPERFPELADTRLRLVTWPAIEPHHQFIRKQLQAGVTGTTAHQRLRDEHRVAGCERS